MDAALGKQPVREVSRLSGQETKREALKRANLAFAESASQTNTGRN